MPASERKLLLERLFEKHVQCDEVSFAKQLYLNLAQLREMHAHGMYIGGHGVNHVHFSNLSLEQQEFEIRGSLDFYLIFIRVQNILHFVILMGITIKQP